MIDVKMAWHLSPNNPSQSGQKEAQTVWDDQQQVRLRNSAFPRPFQTWGEEAQQGFFKEGGTLRPAAVNKSIDIVGANWKRTDKFLIVTSSNELYTYIVMKVPSVQSQFV